MSGDRSLCFREHWWRGFSGRFCTAVTLLIIACLTTRRLSAEEVNCDRPANFAQGEKCYVLQFPCFAEYFGVDGRPDYPTAFKCFRAHKSLLFVALMYANGEGTPRDLSKAASILRSQNSGVEAIPRKQQASLLHYIQACEHRKHLSCSNVDYCTQLAYTTVDDSICEAIRQLAAESEFNQHLSRVRQHLDSSQRLAFDGAVSSFRAYQLFEAGRGYSEFADGTIRDLTGASQAALVREDFLKLIAQAIEEHKLSSTSPAEYQRRTRELDKVLKQNINQITDAWKEASNNGSEQTQFAKYIADYEHSVRESQLRWSLFRDACAALACSVYGGWSNGIDPSVSMKAELTEMRITELRYDPLQSVER